MNAFTVLPIELWQPILALANPTWSLLHSSRFPSTLCQSTGLIDYTWRMYAATLLLTHLFTCQSKHFVGYEASTKRLLGMLPTHDLHRLLFDIPSLSHTLEHECILEHFLQMPTSVLVGQLGGHPLHTICLLFQHAEAACPSASAYADGSMFEGYYQRSAWWSLSLPRQHWDVLNAHYYSGYAIDDPACDPALLIVVAHLVTLVSPALVSSLPKFTSIEQIRQTVTELVTRYDHEITNRTVNLDLDFELAQLVADLIVHPALLHSPTALSLPDRDNSPDILFALHVLIKLGLARSLVAWSSCSTLPFWVWTAMRYTKKNVSKKVVERELRRMVAEIGWEEGVMQVATRVRIPYWSDAMRMRVRLPVQVATGGNEEVSESASVNQWADDKDWGQGGNAGSEWWVESAGTDIARKDWWR